MATEKETVILDFQVDQGSAIAELEKTKKSILGLKKDVSDLNKAYKEENITLDEYASELVRLEGLLKKQQSTYNNTQKAVTGVKTQMDKLIDSNKKISKSFEEAAQNINVAGVNVGALKTQIAGLANPVTAAIGLVTALGAAYSRSSIGAKDLEFAQTQLGFVTDTLTDKFAAMFSSVEDGQGAFTKFLNSELKLADRIFRIPLRLIGLDLTKIAKESEEAALAVEELNTIKEGEALVQSKINERLQENSDLLTDIANAETSIEDKKKAAEKIDANLTENAKARRSIVDAEIIATQKLLDIRKEAGGDTGDIEKEINRLTAERSAIGRDEERQKSRIEKQLNSIVNQETKRLSLERERISAENRQEQLKKDVKEDEKRTKTGLPTGLVDQDQIELDLLVSTLNASFDAQKAFDKKIEEEKFRSAQVQVQISEELAAQEMELQLQLSNELIGLFGAFTEDQKVVALSQIGVDTAQAISAAVKASEQNPANAVTFGGAGALQFAISFTRILANILNAKNILSGAAAGGGDFVTRGPSLLLVGDNPGGVEKVTVEPVSGRGNTKVYGNNLYAMAGGGSLTSGFTDGNASTNSIVNQLNPTIAMANAFKNMPRPEVSVVEITKVQRRVEAKERLSRA